MIEAPIFHVNGDDPEAVVHAAKIAVEFRQKFHKPVVIDMFCYRRFGHNEGDEPAFTQPLMYKKIRAHPTTLEIYAEKLVERRRRHPGRSRQDEGRLAQDARRGIRSRRRPISPTRPIGSTAAGQALQAAADAGGRSAPRQDRRRLLPSCTKSATALCDRAGRLSSPQNDPALPRHAASTRSKRARASTGRRARLWPSRACSTRAIRSGSPARTASAAPSRSAIRC